MIYFIAFSNGFSTKIKIDEKLDLETLAKGGYKEVNNYINTTEPKEVDDTDEDGNQVLNEDNTVKRKIIFEKIEKTNKAIMDVSKIMYIYEVDEAIA